MCELCGKDCCEYCCDKKKGIKGVMFPPQISRHTAYCQLADSSYKRISDQLPDYVDPIAYTEGYLGAISDLGLL